MGQTSMGSCSTHPKPTGLSILVERVKDGFHPAPPSCGNTLIQSGERFILIAPKNYEDVFLFEVVESDGEVLPVQKAIYISYGDLYMQDASTFVENMVRRLVYPVFGPISRFTRSIALQVIHGETDGDLYLIGRFDVVTCSSRVVRNLLFNLPGTARTLAAQHNDTKTTEIVPIINRQLFLLASLLKESLGENVQTPAASQPCVQEKRKAPRPILTFASAYTVIDIETTGLDPEVDGITELAAIRVRNNRPDEFFQTLVYPGKEISEDIQRLTGITNAMVKDQPPLEEVVDRFLEFIGDDILVGHNIVRFDVDFINRRIGDGRQISNRLVDTMWVARKLFGKEIANLRLKTVASFLGIGESEEHRALADSETTFRCYEGMARYAKENHLIIESSRFKDWKASDIKPSASECEEQPLCSQTFVITGNLGSIDRKEAMQRIVDLGGTVKDAITKSTSFLVLGDNGGAITTKHQKALEMQSEGKDIRIISTDEFLTMIYKS